MKYFLLLAFIMLSLSGFSQTLKITSVKVSDSNHYQRMSQKYLGTEMKLTFYDNSLKIESPGHKKPLILEKRSDLEYGFSNKVYSSITQYFVRIVKTVGIITSLEIETRERDEDSYIDKRWVKMTAKRF